MFLIESTYYPWPYLEHYLGDATYLKSRLYALLNVLGFRQDD